MLEHLEHACPRCDSIAREKNGKARGKQRYRCGVCGMKFRENRTRRRQFPPEVISKAIAVFYEGESLRKIGEVIEQEYGSEFAGISPATISRWVRYYAEAVTAELSGIRAATGVSWLICRVRLHYGLEWWIVRDRETGYILSSQVVWDGQKADPKSFMGIALASAVRPCEVFNYIRIDYYWHPKFRDEIDEAAVTGFRDPLNDNALTCTFAESYWDAMYAEDAEDGMDAEEESFVKRIKAMVLKYSWTTKADVLNAYLSGWVFAYNFFPGKLVDSKHPPGQMAQVEIPVKTWEDVVRQADKWTLREVATEKTDLT